MDEGGQPQNGRYRVENYKAPHSSVRIHYLICFPCSYNYQTHFGKQWNILPQHQAKEQSNALVMNKKIMGILADRDAAIQERNLALAEKKEALAQRDEAIQQRELAISERDKALMERDDALAAMNYTEELVNNLPKNSGNIQKKNKSRRKVVKEEEDVEGSLSEGKKFKVEWDNKEADLKVITFDETTMPVPVCSCTGAPRQCYKWGSGGWQSACCTTSISCYPLPQLPNKRHARVGGRKMSGSVYSKLLGRLASDGHDLSVAVDLKEYWARHGTNRYITIK